MFKKLLAGLGMGAASVETELTSPQARPGGVLHGQVRLTGGEVAQEIEGLHVGLVARVHVPAAKDGETVEEVEFHRQPIAEGFTLEAEAEHTVAFTVEVPWETPANVLGGGHLPGIEVGLRTELEIAGGVDQGDLDRVEVHALPVQEHILTLLAGLGCHFHKADLEHGAIRGTGQTLPFFQEIELLPHGYHGLNELEISLITDPQRTQLVVEADKRGGLFVEGSDTFGHFSVPNDAFTDHDWRAILHGWLSEVEQRHNLFGQGDDHHGHHHGKHKEEDEEGSGIGGFLAAGAAGVAGGMVLGEMLDGGEEADVEEVEEEVEEE